MLCSDSDEVAVTVVILFIETAGTVPRISSSISGEISVSDGSMANDSVSVSVEGTSSITISFCSEASDVLVQIAEYFSVTTDYLLGRTGDPSMPFPVSAGERAMLADFRLLDRDQKELIVQNIRLMRSQNER